MHEILGSIPAQAKCIFEVLLHFYFTWKYLSSIKVEVISCNIIYTSPLWCLQQKVFLFRLAVVVMLGEGLAQVNVIRAMLVILGLPWFAFTGIAALWDRMARVQYPCCQVDSKMQRQWPTHGQMQIGHCGDDSKHIYDCSDFLQCHSSILNFINLPGMLWDTKELVGSAIFPSKVCLHLPSWIYSSTSGQCYEMIQVTTKVAQWGLHSLVWSTADPVWNECNVAWWSVIPSDVTWYSMMSGGVTQCDTLAHTV